MRKRITRLVFTALFAALISAGAFIILPVGPVPVVLQNMFALLSGLVIGPVLGPSAVGLFIAAGAVGAPVFANNGSPPGLARIAGPTGGYLFGYLLAALIAGLILGFPGHGQKTPAWRLVLAVAAGTLAVHVPGLLWLKLYLKTDWMKTLTVGFFPFILADALKGVAAGLITPRLRRVAGELLK
jgi:biotin transport system substrate-specific component